MADQSLHELTAAYALDALDEREQAEYEEHLAACERCRDDLAALSSAATGLAYAVEAPPPPPALRQRIVAEAVAERGNVVPLRRRRPVQALAAVAAVAACVAIGLGIWASSLHRSLDRERAASGSQALAVGVIADPASRRVPLRGKSGSLFVAPRGDAALVVSQLAAAPSGRTYEAWVIRGQSVDSAGLFKGGGRTVVALTRRVPRGSTVGVTLERAGGAPAPTMAPFVHARA
ncbi:MAG TPA: anti-sigma factor [Gaiellaceae bacterium]|jgi:anti-sigma factor RsiW